MRALRLASNLSRCTGRASFSRPGVVEESRAFGATPADIYRPRRQSHGVWIAVHGLTICGGREPRLIAFARALADAGLTCVVPTLPDLASCRWDEKDLDALGDVVREAVRGYGRTVGLLGFSFGGSYALRVAARAEHGGEVCGVFAFGAYHRLAPVLAANLGMAAGATGSDADLDKVLYAKLALVLGGHVAAPFTAAQIGEMRSLAARYCTGAGAAEKRDLHERLLRIIAPGDHTIRMPSPELLELLSPAGHLAGLACPVTLIHDVRDPDIPPAHATELFAELSSGAAGGRHRLLLTPLLSHLSPSPVFQPVSIARFVGALARLFP